MSDPSFSLLNENQMLTLSDSNDPDANLYENFTHETSFLSIDEAKNKIIHMNQDFSILNLNIRSISKNFDDFKNLIKQLNFNFKIICITETWCKKDEAKSEESQSKKSFSKYSLPGYKVLHQARPHKKGGGLCIFVHESLNFKRKQNLSVNDNDCEILTIEIINKIQNIIISCVYRQPSGNLKNFKQHLKNHLANKNLNNKSIYLAGDFNLNLLHCETSKHVKNFVNTLLQYNLVPTINKPTRITTNTITLIDNIITNDITNNFTGVIKCDVSDHFPNFLICQKDLETFKNEMTISKRFINKKSIKKFCDSLITMNWELVTETNHAEHSYHVFKEIFTRCYDKTFPKKEVTIKPKTLHFPWMTEGLIRSSKRKQKLYDKYLGKRTYENEKAYKTYKRIFERIKKKAKKDYFSKRINKFQGNSKQIWNTIKDIIGRSKSTMQFPQELKYKNQISRQKPVIADTFNDFFSSIGKNLASKIPISNKDVLSYIGNYDKNMTSEPLTIEELDQAFKSLQANKSPGIDEVDINVVQSAYEIIRPLLFHIFDLSLKQGIFPSDMKIAKVTPIFKSGEKDDPGNYRPISVLPCFSKILEKIMYNRLYEYFTNNDILYKKQFGFQRKHSTEHALLELIDKISDSFEKDEFTIGVFIDLSKAFDTVDHNILTAKLERYGVTDKNLDWFKNYLTGRKQCISYGDLTTTAKKIECGVPQGSILGPLLFLIYVNDLHNASKVLDFILFADDTNLFYSNKNLKTLFEIVNNELTLINEWFIANKLSLNVKKTKYILFCKRIKVNDLPLRLPSLYINNTQIKRVYDTTFLGVIIEESLNWNKHISSIENKISKSIGILYKAKQVLEIESLKKLYFAFIHSYLNYCNIIWGSTFKSNLKKLYSKQKHALRIMFGINKFAPISHRFKELGALNIYQLNISQTINFMGSVKTKTCPKAFLDQFPAISHKYQTRYSKNAFKIQSAKLIVKRFAIKYRGPFMWNNVLSKELKESCTEKSKLCFNKSVKKYIMNLDIEKYF